MNDFRLFKVMINTPFSALKKYLTKKWGKQVLTTKRVFFNNGLNSIRGKYSELPVIIKFQRETALFFSKLPFFFVKDLRQKPGNFAFIF